MTVIVNLYHLKIYSCLHLQNLSLLKNYFLQDFSLLKALFCNLNHLLFFSFLLNLLLVGRLLTVVAYYFFFKNFVKYSQRLSFLSTYLNILLIFILFFSWLQKLLNFLFFQFPIYIHS